jgi:NTE family protein
MSGTALVLSGGGAKGAFQFGAIKYIEEEYKKRHQNFNYSIIAGVSVGAINGTMLAMNKYQILKETWESISADKVYHGNINSTLSILYNLIKSGWRSLLDNDPLYKMIKRFVTLKDIDKSCTLKFGVVSLTTGEYMALSPEDFDNDEDFQKALLASTSIPVIWRPVAKIKTKDSDYTDLVDGGIRNITPLGDVIKYAPSEVIIINCSPSQCTSTEIRLNENKNAGKNILFIARRSLAEIAIDEIFNTDTREFLRINRLVKQAEERGIQLKDENGCAYKAFTTILIEPQSELGDVLDFSREVIRKRIAEGFKQAQEAFAKRERV